MILECVRLENNGFLFKYCMLFIFFFLKVLLYYLDFDRKSIGSVR